MAAAVPETPSLGGVSVFLVSEKGFGVEGNSCILGVALVFSGASGDLLLFFFFEEAEEADGELEVTRCIGETLVVLDAVLDEEGEDDEMGEV